MRTSHELSRDAQQIWQAGVAAVAADRLVREQVRVSGSTLELGEASFDLNGIGRIAVVGAGKAGAAMAAGLEEALGTKWLAAKQVAGWVNIPTGSQQPTSHVHLHPARPAGVNEPTAAGVAGSERILEIVGGLTAHDLCIVLISGGGSALLPAPAAGVSLDDKVAVTRHLSAAGAKIEELNAVRSQLSRIKGGRLARACRAGSLVGLIISDVLGDALSAIASGPTVPSHGTPAEAIAVLDRFGGRTAPFADRVYAFLARQTPAPESAPTARVQNFVIGNNAVAVDAAGAEAERLGYSHAMVSATKSEGQAEEVGRHLAEVAKRMRAGPGPDCLIAGGEPVVRLVDDARRGKGGRNQQLALAAVDALWDDGAEDLVILSGGTDGEDGPTDAAGALVSANTIRRAKELGIAPGPFLASNDAYRFSDQVDGLLVTGPTGTNVCDLRVVVTRRAKQT